MKNNSLITLISITLFQINFAQNSVIYDNGNGLELSTNKGEYIFNIGGFIQPAYRSVTQNSSFSIGSSDSDDFYKSKASVFTFGGDMKKEKLSGLTGLSGLKELT